MDLQPGIVERMANVCANHSYITLSMIIVLMIIVIIFAVYTWWGGKITHPKIHVNEDSHTENLIATINKK
jgi:hypothetical protein